MSNSVVPAAAVAHAKQLVQNKKLIKHKDDHKPAQDEQQTPDKNHDAANAIQTEQAEHRSTSMSDTTLSSDFSFTGALSAAAESSSTLVSATSSADSEGGTMSDDHDGPGGTVLLVGAVGLVGLGVAVLAGGGGGGHSNQAPVFAGDTKAVTTAEDTAVTVAVPATDADNDPLTYSVSTAAKSGTVTGGTADGNFKYTPNTDFNGTDSFVVTVNDGHGGTDTITVNVTITAVNDAPKPDSSNVTKVSTDEDKPAEIVVSFTDPEGDNPLALTLKTDGAHGHVTLVNGKNIYTPNADFNGTDTVVFTVTDSKGNAVDDVVTITVNPVNDAPTVAPTLALSTTAATAVTSTVVGKDVDIATNADVLGYTIASGSQPAHGTATIGATDGKLVYTPTAGFTGTDTFGVVVTDKGGLTATETVTVTVGEPITTKSIDIGTAQTVETLDADNGKFNFTDDSTKTTNVVINHFTADDHIAVTVGKSTDYSFGTGQDPNDLSIAYTAPGGIPNLILLNDVLHSNVFITDYASAVQAVGFNFMSFA